MDGGVATGSYLQTVRRSNRAELAPQAAMAVPLAEDVHGEKVGSGWDLVGIYWDLGGI